MKAISSETSAKVSLFAFLSALAVCALHLPWPAQTPAERVFLTVLHSVLPTALPLFFAISGFFLARRWQEDGWWRRAVGKRARTLLVPYFAWLAIFAAVMAAVAPDLSFFRGQTPMTWFGAFPWRPPRLYPLWFLRGLFLFVLMSPLVVKAVAAGRGLALLASVYGAHLVYSSLMGVGFLNPNFSRLGGFLWYGFSLDGFVGFVLGVMLAIRPPLRRPSPRAVRLCGLAAAALIALRVAALLVLGWSHIVAPNVLIIPPLAVFLWYTVPAAKVTEVFKGSSFPIYLMHYAVIAVYGVLRGAAIGWLECLLLFALAVLVPVFTSRAVRRLSPRLSEFLFGGR